MQKLAWRYSIAIGSVVTVAIALTGAVHGYSTWRETRSAAALRLELEATRAAAQIDALNEHTVAMISAAARIVEVNETLNPAMQQEALYQLLKLPQVVDVWHFDAEGKERAHLSTFDEDVFESHRHLAGDQRFRINSNGKPGYGPLYFFKGSLPMQTISVADADGQMVAAAVSLKHMRNAIADLQIGRSGQAYVVSESGDLIVHRNLDMMLGHINLAFMPQVANALSLASTGARRPGPQLFALTDPTGNELVSTWAPLNIPGWTLVVEQDRNEALAPVWDAMRNSLAFFLLSLLLGIGASVLLARRVTAPISRLRAGADQIGAGNLAHRIATSPKDDDEIGDLARHFNAMATKLESLYETLDSKVQTRTAALVESTDAVHRKSLEVAELNATLQARMADLAEKKAEAERANTAKTRFLAAASHDLRQPMHTIGLLVGLLKTRPHPIELDGLIGNIESSVRVLESLFNSLLDLSRLDRGTLRPDIEVFAVAELLRAVQLSYAPQAIAKGLRFRVAPSHTQVRSDFSMLERVVGNLVSNAIRYTTHGTILLGCRRHGDLLAIQVVDTGCGIPPEHFNDIFEEFVQLANPERDRNKGLGLGLPIVRRTAELLGHEVSVQSQVGRGSVFSISVPAVATLRAVPVASAAAATAQGGGIDGAFVVVVDDDGSAVAAMRALLESWGAQVIGAESGSAALTLLADQLRNPDLIVSDYRLRGRQTGVMVIDAIRAEAGETIPAIIVTGDVSVPAPGQTLPPDTFVLHKPVNLEKLHALASELFARRDATAIQA